MPLAPNLVLGTRWTFIGGKGGVGKTTVAAALALELAESGEKVTILSTDPAHSLGDALGADLTGEPLPLPGLPGLRAFELDPLKEQVAFEEAGGDAIATLIERGTYLDAEDVRSVTDLALPGIDEIAAVLRLGRLTREVDGRVIVDTAPTGHTLRLFDLPLAGLGWLDALEAMQSRSDAVSAAFSRAPREPDREARFVAKLRAELEALLTALQDPVETRFILVANPEAAVLAETARYRAELAGRGVAVGGVILNRAFRRPGPGGDWAAGWDVGSEAGSEPLLRVGRLDLPDAPIDALRLFAAAALLQESSSASDAAWAPGPRDEPSGQLTLGGGFSLPDDRRLYFVGGKGGVGKTTVAASIAGWLSAHRGGPVLLISVDPAGSLSEILDEPVGSAAQPLRAFPGLHARQLDAESAWSVFALRHQDEFESLLDGIGGVGTQSKPDREILDRLTELAPPGIDELVAVAEVIDLLEDGQYDAVVVDTAPTGHFLRLLEMPAVARQWSHALLRLLLKYRSVIRLEGAGERVLELSRSLRTLHGRLLDPSFSWFGVVALPESLSVPESKRLIESMKRLGIEPEAMIVNRLLNERGEIAPEAERRAGALLTIDRGLRAAATPNMADGPSGARLEAFFSGWRTVAPAAP